MKITTLTRKFIFFYLLIHVIALTSSLISITPSFVTHSMTQRERDDLKKQNSDIQSEAQHRKFNKEQDFLTGLSSFASYYLNRPVEISRDMGDYSLNSVIQQVQQKFEERKNSVPQEIKDIYAIEMTHLILLQKDRNYNSGVYAEPVTVNLSAPTHIVDNVKEYFVLTNDNEQYNKKFWPFSKYIDKTYSPNQFNKTTFLGIFSGYDLTEFGFYVLLPLIIIGLTLVYIKFVK